MPIRSRLTLFFLVVTAAVTTLMRAGALVYEYLEFRKLTLHQLATISQILAASSTVALKFRNTEEAYEILQMLKADRYIVSAALYDRQGTLFAKYPTGITSDNLPPRPGEMGFAFSERTVAGFHPVIEGEQVGTLYLKWDAGPMIRQWVRDSLWMALAVLAAALVVAYGFSRILQTQIAQPILTLAETARAISERRDYSVRAVNRGADELGLLTDAFNQLLEQIHAQKIALDHHAIVAITNPQGRITYVNDKFCAISQFSRAELLGMDHSLVKSGKHSSDFIRSLWMTIASGQVWSGEINNRAKDGSSYWVKTTIVPFVTPVGQPYEYVAISGDITDQKRAEDEINLLNRTLEEKVIQRTAQLENANKELEAFSYSVSHDLRAPLRHIDGFAQMLRTRVAPKLDVTEARYLGNIIGSAKGAGTLIDELLAFSRMGRTEIRYTQVDVGKLVREVLDELQPEIQKRRIDWEIDALPIVQGDPAMLRQVWSNLLGNALKYSRSRDPAAIAIGYRHDATHGHVFSVRDNGAGFDMAYVDKLFGVFQRLHTANEFEGTGIGLANVRRIVHRHGGTTWAEGAINKGAMVSFALPVSVAPASHILP